MRTIKIDRQTVTDRQTDGEPDSKSQGGKRERQHTHTHTQTGIETETDRQAEGRVRKECNKKFVRILFSMSSYSSAVPHCLTFL